jgi:molybdopterin molybdotransferase
VGLLPVEDALARVLEGATRTPVEDVAIAEALGRTLARDHAARLSNPPSDVSAMDGYAMRRGDAIPGAVLTLIGESIAGRGADDAITDGRTIRIFTGARVPPGADLVVIQENVRREGDRVIVLESPPARENIRRAGFDFAAGAVLPGGTRLDARAIGLAAAMGHATLCVHRAPRVGVLSTGDELVTPGIPPGPDQIVSSNALMLEGLVRAAGGEPVPLGIVADDPAATRAALADALQRGLHVLVTIGGASVGDRDLVRAGLGEHGLDLAFWKIAMRPGKPLIHGRLGPLPVLGLPGNPVSAFACGRLFLAPLLRAMQGDPDAAADGALPCRIGRDLPANDERMDLMRASLDASGDDLVVTPFPAQDSGMIATLARARALLIRAPHAPAAPAGAPGRCLLL